MGREWEGRGGEGKGREGKGREGGGEGPPGSCSHPPHVEILDKTLLVALLDRAGTEKTSNYSKTVINTLLL